MMLAGCVAGALDRQSGANVVVARLDVQQPVVSSFADKHEVRIQTQNIQIQVHTYKIRMYVHTALAHTPEDIEVP